MRVPRREIGRKALHVALSLPAAYVVWRLPYPESAIILLLAVAVSLAVEVARLVSERFRAWFRRVFGLLLRSYESGGLTGASTLSTGYALTTITFGTVEALAGILIAGLSDPVAGLVGQRFGRWTLPGGKTVEGSAAFFVCAAVIAGLATDLGIGAAVAVGAAVAIVEAVALPVDDNLYLALAGAGAVAIASGF